MVFLSWITEKLYLASIVKMLHWIQKKFTSKKPEVRRKCKFSDARDTGFFPLNLHAFKRPGTFLLWWGCCFDDTKENQSGCIHFLHFSLHIHTTNLKHQGKTLRPCVIQANLIKERCCWGPTCSPRKITEILTQPKFCGISFLTKCLYIEGVSCRLYLHPVYPHLCVLIVNCAWIQQDLFISKITVSWSNRIHVCLSYRGDTLGRMWLFSLTALIQWDPGIFQLNSCGLGRIQVFFSLNICGIGRVLGISFAFSCLELL